MATNKVTPKRSGGKTPTPKKAPSKKTRLEEAVSNGPVAVTKAEFATEAKRLPAATIRALKELEGGELTRYDDADDLFRKLGIKLGED